MLNNSKPVAILAIRYRIETLPVSLPKHVQLWLLKPLLELVRGRSRRSSRSKLVKSG